MQRRGLIAIDLNNDRGLWPEGLLARPRHDENGNAGQEKKKKNRHRYRNRVQSGAQTRPNS